MKLYYYSNELVWDMSENRSRQQYDPNAAERVKRWRENNREQYREYQRELMKQRRQRKRLDSSDQTD